MKRAAFIILIVVVILFPAGASLSQPQMQLIKDVRGEIFDDSAEIVIEANCDIDYIDYTLPDPPRLIIDPLGKVYSDLRDVIAFDEGTVKEVTIVKGKPEEGLTGNYYPLDFISIELTAAPEYTVRKDIKEEVIIEITKKKEAEAEAAPEPIEPTETIKTIETIETIETLKKEAAAVSETMPEPAVEAAPAKQELIPLLEEEPKREPDAAVVVEPSRTGYKIGESDTLDISVWQHPELDKKVVVRPDGFVSFPLVGDIRAAGLAPPQLASDIKEDLSRLIKDPQVTVIVTGFGSKNILVLGEIAKPGVYRFRGGMNILEAISEAGGWKNSAVLNSVMLVRRVFTDQPEAHRLNVYAIIKKGDFSQNMMLQPQDVVYVPKSFIANIGGFIENLRVSIGAYITETTKVLD